MQANDIQALLPILMNVIGIFTLLFIMAYMIYGEEEEE